MSPTTARLARLLANVGADPGGRRVVAARRRGHDRPADRLDRSATLVDAVGAAQAARSLVAGHRGGQAG
jgi:hypothetical protein